MKSTTLSVRLDETDLRMLDKVAAIDGVDRSTLVKRYLRRGQAVYRFEAACEAYRRGEVSLSRAAEMAGLPLATWLARLPEGDLHLDQRPEDLRRELET